MADTIDERARNDRRAVWTRPGTIVLVATIALVAVWLAVGSTLSLGASAARTQIEARIAEMTGQPVLVDGRADFRFLPRPRLSLHDVRIGGMDPQLLLQIDQLHAELDLFDAVFGKADIANLILVRAELGRGTPTDAAVDGSYGQAAAYGRSVLERFDGVRRIELREGAFRPADGSAAITSANLQMSWPAPGDPARMTGSFVWNGQTARIDVRVAEPTLLLSGEPSALRLFLEAPSLSASFEGRGRGGEARSLDGDLRLAAPSLGRAARWLGISAVDVPDIDSVAVESRVRFDGETRLSMNPVQVTLGKETGEGVVETSLQENGRPLLSGTIAFPDLTLDRIAGGIAPLPRGALDFQRPMSVSFVDRFDLDLRLSAARAAFGELALSELGATLLFQNGRGILDIGDAELLGGRAQGKLSLDVSGPRPLARGRVDLTGVDAAPLAALAGFHDILPVGRADLSAEFEAPATNWAEILRENASRIRLTIGQGALTGVSADIFLTPGEHALTASSSSATVPVTALTADLGTRGPYATLDALRIEGPAGVLSATGFLSLLDDRMRVEGVFDTAREFVGNGEEAFTTSQPVPFMMQGEWPRPTVTVEEPSGERPI